MRVPVILVAVLVLPLSGCVELMGQDPVTLASVHVPVSRVGDVVHYEARAEMADGTMTPWRNAREISIVGQPTIYDYAGRAVNAVQVDVSGFYTHVDEAGTEHEMRDTSHIFLDPEARLPIRTDYSYGFEFDNLLIEDCISSVDSYGSARIPGLEIQGQTLTERQPIAVTFPPLDPNPIDGHVGGGGGGAFGPAGHYLAADDHTEVDWSPKTERHRVYWADENLTAGDARTIDGATAIPVVARQEGSSAADTSASLEWYDGSSPYPFLIESFWEDTKGDLHRQEMRKDREVHGDVPVLWSKAPDLTDLLIRRGPADQRYPADGDLDLPYPLADALHDAGTIPTLLAWQATHSRSNLVAAWMRHGRLDNSRMPSTVWQLAYAEPSGAGHVVSVERPDDGLGQPILQDHGDLTLGSYGLDELPLGPITLGTAAAYWKTFDPARAKPVPDFINWGFQLDWKTGAPCFGESYDPGRHYPGTQLSTLVVGSYTGGSCVEPTADLVTSAIGAQTGLGVFFGGIVSRTKWQ